ncbi:MAG: hypothetical protein D6719_10845 [Candidatus Dadabacteria bacterium]|nr:MAG: hypothetical protein D6719_10845 [Candidatus Dadabacteria bacterium]
MSTAKKKKNNMTREEARALYDQLKAGMNRMVKERGGELPPDALAAAAAIKRQAGGGKIDPRILAAAYKARNGSTSITTLNRGHVAAISFVLLFTCLKLSLSAIEGVELMTVPKASATLSAQAKIPVAPMQKFTPEEVKILKALDQRRAELEKRARGLDKKAGDLELREREYAAKLTELRELTQKLKLDREKNARKRDAQIDQLANVYSSMNPKEAAALIEQLDITIAIGLLKRMPEKRIGQILALMSPERALNITRLLSGTKQ